MWRKRKPRTLIPKAKSAPKTPLSSAEVLDSLPAAVLFVDHNHRIQLANSACSNFFPTVSHWADRSLISVVLDHRIDRLVETARVQGKTQRELIDKPASQDDQQIWWHLDAEPLQVGEQTWVRLIVRDESERQRLEQIRRDFVANASHELRTPLTILRGNLENLLDGGLAEPELAQRFVATALRHTERLGRLVEDMLTISQLEHSEDIPLHYENFELAELTHEVLERLETVRSAQNARFRVEIPADFGPCQGDAFYWEQILYNLVENSLRKNPQRPEFEVSIHAGRNEDSWWLEIRDNGIGIPRADLPFIFKRFYLVQKDHGPARHGTGLGLSIVKRAVEAHHGQITVTSTPGRETCFRIEVPNSPDLQ